MTKLLLLFIVWAFFFFFMLHCLNSWANNNKHIRNCKMCSGHPILIHCKVSNVSTFGTGVLLCCSFPEQASKSFLAILQSQQNGSKHTALSEEKQKQKQTQTKPEKEKQKQQKKSYYYISLNNTGEKSCGRWKGEMIWVSVQDCVSHKSCRAAKDSQGYLQECLQRPREMCECSSENKDFANLTENLVFMPPLYCTQSPCGQFPILPLSPQCIYSVFHYNFFVMKWIRNLFTPKAIVQPK